MTDAPEKVGPCRMVRDLYDDHIGYWRPRHEAMTQERAFLDGERYEDDNGAYNRDRRLIQIRGQETQDTIRHIVAQCTRKPRNVEARPVDLVDDANSAEIAASLVEHELSNVWKGFDDAYEETLQQCRENRVGVLWMDWDPDCGPFGEMLYRADDSRRYMWDEAYHPHHPKCAWLLQQIRVPHAVAKRMYQKATWLQPDRDSVDDSGKFKPGIPLIYGATGERLPLAGGWRDDKVTLWRCWYKDDYSEQPNPRPLEPQEMKPEQRYMSCQTCGWRSPTQGALKRQDKLSELPEDVQGGCSCGGDLMRVDAKQPQQYVRQYTNGRRLIIMAPLSPGPLDEPLYDGDWPIPTVRSFPALFLFAYIKPGSPVPPSDVTYMWDQQIASDNLRTLAIQRIYEHRTYWKVPRTGLYDYRGRRFTFRDDQFNVMYEDATDALGPNSVQVLSGTGLDPGFMVAFNVTQQALTAYRGVADIGLTPDNSKDIPASTLAQLTQQGEVPTEHFNRRKNRALSQFYGCAWDYIRATYTHDRLARLRIDGVDMVNGLQGDDLPNYDFAIEDTPDFTGLEKGKKDAFEALMQVMQTAPMMLDIFAEVNNFPPSIVRKLEKRMAEIQASQQPDPNAPPGAAPGGGVGPGGAATGAPPAGMGAPPPDAASNPIQEAMAGLGQ